VKILIVGDDEDARMVLKKTLEHAGYCVEAACKGRGALQRVEAFSPDMIISDILMPEMDGFRLCGALKARPEFKKIPFVFYTASCLDPPDARLAKALGGSRYIEKPMAPSGLLKAIREVLQECRQEALPVPEKPEESPAALFTMYEESLSNKLQQNVSELRLYKSIFQYSKDAIAIVDRDRKYLKRNPAHQALIGYPEGSLCGKTPAIHLGGAAETDIFRQISEKGAYFGERVSRSASGKKIDIELSAFPIRNEQGEIHAYVGITRDISGRKRAERLVSDQQKVLELISRGKVGRSGIFEAIIRIAEAHCPGVRASILLLEGRRCRSGAAPSLPSAYNRLIDGLQIGPAAGSCGTAMYRKVRVVVEDVQRDPLWADFRHLGTQYGFRACWSEPILDADGKVLGSFALYRRQVGAPDEGEIRLIESMSYLAGLAIERKQSEEKIRTLFQAIEQSPVSVMITDTDAKIEYVNPAFEEITGYHANEVRGKNPRFLQSGKTPQKSYEALWQALSRGKTWQGEFLNRKKSGETFWEKAHIAPVLDESGHTRHYLALKEDISLQKKQEAQLLHQAHFDALTGLPNRFLSLDRLAQRLREARRNKTLVAVLFLDLDDFKKVNDTLGHEVGDQLLVDAAKRLRRVARREDTIGRLGGDEFIILLGGLLAAPDVRPVVQHFIDQFSASFRVAGRELILTATVGIAIFPGDGEDPSTLLRAADSAMYHAKSLGRNTFSYFTEAMNREVSRRLELEEQMHGALGRQEFEVFYQPLVDLGADSIIGAEALIRWHNPVLGRVSPAELIPVAEQSGLIVSLGQFVLTTALETCARLRLRYSPAFRMAVNLSPRQFQDPGLLGFIQAALRRAGVSGDGLELEITEGVLLSGHRQIDKALTGLNQMGISISMDDFGTGYSSLSYLRRYPFDVLKIDQSFVRDITLDQADQALIQASIAMAHALKLKVVAEGVETKVQLADLKRQGCDYAQGYLFAKPMSGDALLAWLSERTQT